MNPVIARPVRRLLALALFALAAYLVVQTVLPLVETATAARYSRSETLGGSSIQIDADPLRVWFPFQCIEVRWEMTPIRALFVDDEPEVGTGDATVCDGAAALRVTLADGSEETYELETRSALDKPLSLAAAMLLALALAGYGVWLLGVRVTLPHVVARRLLDGLFVPAPPRWWAWGVLALLFLLGAAHWTTLLNDGSAELQAYDFPMTIEYWQLQKAALSEGQLPYFSEYTLRNGSLYLGTPDVGWSPLAPWWSKETRGQFALANVLLWYAVGFAGSLWLRARWRLSLLAFAGWWLIFNVNGHIVAHIAIGHMNWLSYFCLPFVLLCLFDIAAGAPNAVQRGVMMAFALGVMNVLGGFHQWTWIVLALLALLAAKPSAWRAVGTALVGSAGLSALRFLPAALVFGGEGQSFRSGYVSLDALLDALLTMRAFDYNAALDSMMRRTLLGNVNWGEHSMFVGAAGLLFIAVAGVALRFSRDPRLTPLRFAALDAPVALLFVLSLGRSYELISQLPLPLLSGERISTRFIIVPVLILTLAGVLRLNALMPLFVGQVRWMLLALAAWWVTALGLVSHAALWSLSEIENRYDNALRPLTGDLIVAWDWNTLTAREQVYVVSFPVGVAVTVVTAAVLVWLYRRAGRRAIIAADVEPKDASR